MPATTQILVIEKNGNIKTSVVSDPSNVEELLKKCGLKKAEGFAKQVEWKVKLNKVVYKVYVYGKKEGRGTMENKYDFPPPIDTTLFFGSCAVVARTMEDNAWFSVTESWWEKVYEKLFGGFEDLHTTSLEDEKEVDELKLVPKNKKTKTGGYLKDGFVVDDSDEEGEGEGQADGQEPEEEEEEEEDDDDDDAEDEAEEDIEDDVEDDAEDDDVDVDVEDAEEKGGKERRFCRGYCRRRD